MTTRTHEQTQASKMNGSRSSGPTTSSGKAKSSLNALRTGARACRVLLTDEPANEYLAEAQRWVESLQPVTKAEEEIVFDLIDVRVRLARVDKAEKKMIVAAVAEALQQERLFQRQKLQSNAITALVAMKCVIDSSHPTDVGQLTEFLSAIRDVIDVTKQVEVLHDCLVPGLLQLDKAVANLETHTGEEWPEATYRSLSHFALIVEADLQRRKEADGVKVKEIEVDLAQEAVPKNDADGKRLESYRRQLERRFKVQLDVLEQLRRLRFNPASGSFVRSVLLNLRSQPASPALAQQ